MTALASMAPGNQSWFNIDFYQENQTWSGESWYKHKTWHPHFTQSGAAHSPAVSPSTTGRGWELQSVWVITFLYLGQILNVWSVLNGELTAVPHYDLKEQSNQTFWCIILGLLWKDFHPPTTQTHSGNSARLNRKWRNKDWLSSSTFYCV